VVYNYVKVHYEHNQVRRNSEALAVLIQKTTHDSVDEEKAGDGS